MQDVDEITEIPSSNKRKNDDTSDSIKSTKKQRFELKCGEENSWDLPSGLAQYVQKYMNQHIPEKEIIEKFLSNYPVPNNIKSPQVLDNYIKELLNDNKKVVTINHEKVLKSLQEKITYIMGPLSTLWSIMEAERDQLDANNEEAESLNEMSSLFEQTALLIAQTYNSVAHHRRANILSTLIDNQTKVKEILRDQSDEMDDPNNEFLFGDKFEERLSVKYGKFNFFPQNSCLSFS